MRVRVETAIQNLQTLVGGGKDTNPNTANTGNPPRDTKVEREAATGPVGTRKGLGKKLLHLKVRAPKMIWKNEEN